MPAMVPVTLADLTTPTTADHALTLSLSLCQQFGLPTQAWQPIQMIPTVIETNAVIAADASSSVALIAQGGYASLAALMVDANGAPITTWMQLRATDQYGITPGPATFASGPVPYTNTSATSYPYSPNNPLHAQNQVTGATYTSTGTGTISGSTSGTVNFQADVAGASGTSGTGVTLTLTTPLAGVTLTALAQSLVGSDAESNQNLLTRGRNKLSTLAPIQSTDQAGPVANGARGVYDYVARTIPQASSASAVPPYAVTSPITRTSKSDATGTGLLTVWIANAMGTPPAEDIAAVRAACNALVTGDGVLLTVAGAVPVSIGVQGTVYLRSSSGITSDGAKTNIADALATYISNVPIGGVTTSSPNIVPFSDILQTVFDANRGTSDVQLTTPSGNTALASDAVPQLGTVAITIVFV